jgi:subtilisin-like proprotein convertase family protein
MAAAGLPISLAHAQPKPNPIPQTFTLVDSRPMLPAKPALTPLSVSLGVHLGGEVPAVVLGPLNEQQLIHEDADAAAAGDKRLRYGVGRDVALGMMNGRWDDCAGGRLWSGDIIATGAVGIRVHLVNLALPVKSQVVVYSVTDPGPIAGPYEGSGPFVDGQVWTPTRAGERIRIECFVAALPPGQVPGADLFRVDRIQHIYRDPTTTPVRDNCHNDVTCFSNWANTAKACAGIGTISQNSLFCSGQLLNTVTGDQTPYYLTANHCVPDSTTAQTAEVYFNFRTPVCNGVPPVLTTLPQAAVCTLLSDNWSCDSSLLMIQGALPSGLAWAGWTAAVPADGTAAACIHFPQGTYERISFGNKASNTTCSTVNHIRMNWTSGPTEPGSSGGGVFTDDANQQLFGQLDCGPSACGSVTNDDFGSFAAFYPSIATQLAAGSDDAFEPNDTCATATDLVPGSYNNLIVKSTSEDWYRLDVVPGGTVSVQVSFTNAYGDIDLQLFTLCGGAPIATSSSQTNSESIIWTNSTGTVQTAYFRVYLVSGTRNSYSMTVSNGPPPPTGACCMPSYTCSITTASNCAMSGGVYAGDSTICSGACHTYNYSGPAIAIPDGLLTGGCGATAVASVSVPDSFSVAGITTGVYIVHTYQGDVTFSLKHTATGRTVTLVDRPGVPQSPYGFANDNYGASPTALFYSLWAAAHIYDIPATLGIDNVTGAWKPEGPLDSFVGENSAGTWQLLVQDCANGDTGTVNAFRLTLAQAVPVAQPCYANCDGSTISPILNANDFACFLNAFAAGSSYANCDNSTTPPVLNANDFQCFLNAFSAGCS